MNTIPLEGRHRISVSNRECNSFLSDVLYGLALWKLALWNAVLNAMVARSTIRVCGDLDACGIGRGGPVL
jgi:hypothetical protein